MAAKHTPGPFSLEVRPDGNIDIGPLESGSVSPLATVYGDDNEPECWPVTANAKLLAAAPDLAEALEGFLRAHAEDGCCGPGAGKKPDLPRGTTDYCDACTAGRAALHAAGRP